MQLFALLALPTHIQDLISTELKIDDVATPRRGVYIYDKKKVFWNFMSVTTV